MIISIPDNIYSLFIPISVITLVSSLLGLVGPLVLWRRYSYLGDGISHSALLGSALGIFLGLNPWISNIIICLVFTNLIYIYSRKISFNTSIGIFASFFLSVSILLSDFIPEINLMNFLVGDPLLSVEDDIYLLVAVLSVTSIFIILNFRKIVLATIHKDIASVYYPNAKYLDLITLNLLAIVISISAKIVGVLIVVAFLLLPASIAATFSTNPKRMIINSTLMGLLCGIGGFLIAIFIDSSVSATIVAFGSILFIILHSIKISCTKS